MKNLKDDLVIIGEAELDGVDRFGEWPGMFVFENGLEDFLLHEVQLICVTSWLPWRWYDPWLDDSVVWLVAGRGPTI